MVGTWRFKRQARIEKVGTFYVRGSCWYHSFSYNLSFGVSSVKINKNKSLFEIIFFRRTRLAMQKDNFSYKNIMNAIKILSEKEGYISFYSGLTITIMVNAHFFFNKNESKPFLLFFNRAASRESFHITALDSFHTKFSKGSWRKTIPNMLNTQFLTFCSEDSAELWPK